MNNYPGIIAGLAKRKIEPIGKPPKGQMQYACWFDPEWPLQDTVRGMTQDWHHATPRNLWTQEFKQGLDDLEASFLEEGMLNPILVTKTQDKLRLHPGKCRALVLAERFNVHVAPTIIVWKGDCGDFRSISPNGYEITSFKHLRAHFTPDLDVMMDHRNARVVRPNPKKFDIRPL